MMHTLKIIAEIVGGIIAIVVVIGVVGAIAFMADVNRNGWH